MGKRGGPAREGVICCTRSAGAISHSATQPAEFYESINLSSFINLCPIQKPVSSGPAVSLQTHPFMAVWKAPIDWQYCPAESAPVLTGEMGQSKQGLKAEFAHHRVPRWLLKWTLQWHKWWLFGQNWCFVWFEVYKDNTLLIWEISHFSKTDTMQICHIKTFF